MIRLPTPYPTRRFDNEEIFQVDKALEVPSGADDGDASHSERLAVTARQDETRPLALDENLFGQGDIIVLARQCFTRTIVSIQRTQEPGNVGRIGFACETDFEARICPKSGLVRIHAVRQSLAKPRCRLYNSIGPKPHPTAGHQSRRALVLRGVGQ